MPPLWVTEGKQIERLVLLLPTGEEQHKTKSVLITESPKVYGNAA
jgi:hypothetical protein